MTKRHFFLSFVLTRFNPETDKVGMSYTKFKTKDVNIIGEFIQSQDRWKMQCSSREIEILITGRNLSGIPLISGFVFAMISPYMKGSVKQWFYHRNVV